MSDSERPHDLELAKLLLEELARHAPGLSSSVPSNEQRRALHALKGSAALAGERGLAEALARLERRLAAGDGSAVPMALGLVHEAKLALEAGNRVPAPTWPHPPSDLGPSLSPVLPSYVAEMRDRLERVDAALSAQDNDIEAAASAFREVHAMKGAALAASDDTTAWFCHGLEERLRHGDRSEADAARALAELSQWRGVLAELVVSPERALEALRILSRRGASMRPPVERLEPPSSRRLSSPWSSSSSVELSGLDVGEVEPRSGVADETLRVPTSTLERLLERVRQIAQSRARVTSGASLVLSMSTQALRLRLGLGEALRLIGPPRPWGAPAAAIARIDAASREIGLFAERLDREATLLKETADRLRDESAAAHSDLAEIRTTRVAWLFERVARAAGAEARRAGREARFVFAGEETAIGRRVAELLFDPVLQLARNAVAHGIESASERALRGKPRALTIQLAAEVRSGGLRLAVRDDGAGVNVADVRIRAVASGTIGAETARAADDETLLALLFVPGFTTRDSADLLAGRGVGLDLALEAVHRLGGTIRLATEAGLGVTATIDVPFEPGLVKVVWVESGGATYAIPVQPTRRVALARDCESQSVTPLASLIGATPETSATPELTIELDANPAARFVVGVDRIGAVEEVTVRAISPLIATAGPFSGAIVRGDELFLCLDAHALAERVAARAIPPADRRDP